MQFKVDENLHREIATAIAARGHDASTVHDQDLTGADAPSRAEHCRSEGRVLVTLDLDFADIRTYPQRKSPGIVVFRLRDQSRPSTLRVLSTVLDHLERETLTGKLWIVSESGVRVRE